MLRKIMFVLVILFSALLPAAALADNNIVVQQLSFPVTLSDGNTYTIAGYLYYQGSYQNKPLQVLVHGGGYNHLYWDVPSINNNKYSYARYMAEEKYAVLAIDQLGTGQSSKPNGDFVTLAETASAIHQVIGQMRSGNNALGQPFNKIVLVGHSFGSINAITVQATYHDADALVITALGHVPHELPFTNEFLAELAQYEYFTLPPEVRSAVFYSAPAADPDVIAYDNANLIDQITRGQLFTTFAAIFNDSVAQVSGPVLVQLGQNDALWPASYANGEAAYWTSASSITVQSLPDVGHSFNTHLDNKRGWKQISQWLSATAGWN
ncbi:MAG: alpha/beta hydrolase [Anaerolineae bacterium]|nr:alpha/beta hydrolase [Anaerolineae bacterium]MCB0180808.1 alpha/beta hydrolase [Anaerolineae bacterium]MCB0224631.1 alpha/beta hydrolase [Anaerolineae bacterium]MCB9106978.1 alpha/beta hydrolase [Anaerolineales bacterium]